jgi:hypothetical protein
MFEILKHLNKFCTEVIVNYEVLFIIENKPFLLWLYFQYVSKWALCGVGRFCFHCACLIRWITFELGFMARLFRVYQVACVVISVVVIQSMGIRYIIGLRTCVKKYFGSVG